MIPALRLIFIAGLYLVWPGVQPLHAQASFPEFPEGREGLQAMCEYLLEADYQTRKKFTATLLPDLQDCKAAFHEDKAKAIYRFLKRIRQRHILMLTPEYEAQTQITLSVASQDDFRHYRAQAIDFPGGYREMAPYLMPHLAYYRILFAEPGHKIGSSHEVLVYVNGHWRFFLSPWVACME